MVDQDTTPTTNTKAAGNKVSVRNSNRKGPGRNQCCCSPCHSLWKAKFSSCMALCNTWHPSEAAATPQEPPSSATFGGSSFFASSIPAALQEPSPLTAFAIPLQQPAGRPTAPAPTGPPVYAQDPVVVYPEPRAEYISATEMHDDWYGRGDSVFSSEGGMVGLEENHRNAWHKGYNSGDNKRFSRIKFIVGELKIKEDSLATAGVNDPTKAALQFFDTLMKNKNKMSLSGLERLLKTAKSARDTEAAVSAAATRQYLGSW